MILLRHIIAPVIILLALTSCHEDSTADLYQYTLNCVEGLEIRQYTFTDSREQKVKFSEWTNSVEINIKNRHNHDVIEKYNWFEPVISCVVHKKKIGKLEPTVDDN